MPHYVAFLRAINVGGRTVRMDALRRVFEQWGAADVETFIASGNVVFRTSRANAQRSEEELEAHLQQALGYPVATFLRTIAALAEVAAYQPFPQAELDRGGRVFVAFMKRPAARAVADAIAALRTDLDDFAIAGRELYWLRHGQLMQSVASGPTLERLVGSPLTMRNANTVKRLAARYCGGAK